jgi:hypothetical protein
MVTRITFRHFAPAWGKRPRARRSLLLRKEQIMDEQENTPETSAELDESQLDQISGGTRIEIPNIKGPRSSGLCNNEVIKEVKIDF